MKIWDREAGRVARCCLKSTGVRGKCFQGEGVGVGELRRGCGPLNSLKLVKPQVGKVLQETGR